MLHKNCHRNRLELIFILQKGKWWKHVHSTRLEHYCGKHETDFQIMRTIYETSTMFCARSDQFIKVKVISNEFVDAKINFMFVY